MSNYSISIQRESDADGGEFACSVIAHHFGVSDSVRLDVRFDKAEDVATWVEEAVNAWL